MYCSIYEKRFQLGFCRDAAVQTSQPSSLPVSSFFQGIALISSNRKKAATKVFIVRAKRVSADQMNRTGTMITPSNIRRMMVIFSLRLDIYINSGTRYKAQGIKQEARSQNPGVSSERQIVIVHLISQIPQFLNPLSQIRNYFPMPYALCLETIIKGIQRRAGFVSLTTTLCYVR